MYQVGYVFSKLKIKITRIFMPSKCKEIEKKVLSGFFRKHGVTVGENCVILSNISSSESYLISIGNNVTISNDVQIITHDNSIDKVLDDVSDIFGAVSIGNDCFIGAHSLILCGITLADRIIVGSGSVVTKSFTESGIIIAGNPAQKIGTWSEFAKKYADVAFNLKGGKKAEIDNNPRKIIRNR